MLSLYLQLIFSPSLPDPVLAALAHPKAQFDMPGARRGGDLNENRAPHSALLRYTLVRGPARSLLWVAAKQCQKRCEGKASS